jgi:hypothetical protein
MNRSILIREFCLAAIFSATTAMQVSAAMGLPQQRSPRGDGIFTPIISAVAIDKTGRPITVEVRQPERRFSDMMVAGKPTGDSYVINFSTGAVGGPCVYTGTARYFIESTGVLTFQTLAECGKLKRGYSYMVCMLDEDLRCSEAPWWYFKDQTYSITNQGVTISGSTMIPWKDTSEAPQELQTMAARIKSMRNRFRNDPHVLHSRFISCRNFHPATQSYDIYELSTMCTTKSCDGIPSVDSLRDGDPIDWNSPVGSYVKQHRTISDASTWTCWIRTQ